MQRSLLIHMFYFLLRWQVSCRRGFKRRDFYIWFWKQKRNCGHESS